MIPILLYLREFGGIKKRENPRTAIEGLCSAFTTIIDANFTTLVAALVLYQFGTGPIRGFATVLFGGIIISMFTLFL
ncbi:MAG: hypothetical protein CM1200mP10_01360 [Candidatus Neomarinimicrobiota bacterium]|nr:MAG: hypothetical protein CM1200mP10_01360 [Candidatus Neomarinimicrobiota bacterium]